MNIIIEICGMPATGKTTAINSLKAELRKSIHFDKIVFIDDPSLTNPLNTKKTDIDFNIWNMNTIINAVLTQEDKIFIVEKGFYDLLAWMKYHLIVRNTTNAEYSLLYNYLMNNRWKEQTYKLIMLTCTDETIFIRRPQKGRIINKNVIEKLSLAYNDLEHCVSNKTSNEFIKIDTDNLSIVEANRIVLEEVEKVINSNLHFV